MEYIQKVFLNVQAYLQEPRDLENVIAFIDAEPPEFRSVAYESAAMELAMHELPGTIELKNWKKFYESSLKAHTFHMDIGLGWAFAKKGISPGPYLEFLHPVMNWMVFDGIGYYNGLFRGRRTVKSQWIPEDVDEHNLYGFDQGLGRRLWYISMGEVNKLVELMNQFPVSRQPDLWRGVGIACGYVGGCVKANLEQLLIYSVGFKEQLSTGVALAAISRNASNSITGDIELTCEIICRKPIIEVLEIGPAITDKFYLQSIIDNFN